MTEVKALILQTGAHASAEKGACLMEAAAACTAAGTGGDHRANRSFRARPNAASTGQARGELGGGRAVERSPGVLVGTRADRAVELRRAFRLAVLTLLAMWVLPVPYLWWTVRRDTLVEKRTWRTGLVALVWPAVLLFVAVVAAIGTRKRMWP